MSNIKTVEVSDALAHLDDLLSSLDENMEIVLTCQDVPVARLTPLLNGNKKRVADLHQGSITMSEDFDVPLPDQFWTQHGMKVRNQ